MLLAADPLRLPFPPRAARVLDPQLETTRWLDELLANWEMDGLTYWICIQIAIQRVLPI